VLAGVLVASVALVGAFYGFSGPSHPDSGPSKASRTKTKTARVDKTAKVDQAARPRQSPPRLEAPPQNTPSARMNALADAMDRPATEKPATEKPAAPTLAPEHDAKDAEVPTPPTPPTPPTRPRPQRPECANVRYHGCRIIYNRFGQPEEHCTCTPSFCCPGGRR